MAKRAVESVKKRQRRSVEKTSPGRKHRIFARVDKPIAPSWGGRVLAALFYAIIFLPLLYYLVLSGTRINVSSLQGVAGEVLLVRVAGISPWVDAAMDYQGESYPLFKVRPWSRLGMIPLAAGVRPGKKELVIKSQEGPFRWRRKVELDVLEIIEELQHLKMPARKMALWRRKKIKQERQELRHVLSTAAVGPFFQGAFILPLVGRTSTNYGVKRVLNKTTDYGYHRGVDIAAPAGTPLFAANAGWIVYAKENIIGGNTIIIEHGWGVHTLYMHLQRLLVKEGSQVSKGQAIGLVGSTGFSTGPHLHWGFYVNGVAVDGRLWTECEEYRSLLQ